MAQTQGFNLQNFGQLLARLTPSQVISLSLFVVLVTVGIVAGSYFMGQESYQLLYSGMNPEDAGTVTAKLKELKVPYRLEAGGTAVSVPAERVDEMRVSLASAGLPQSGRIGFEIFDRTNFGMSEFTEQVNFRRALEGELSRSVASLMEVATARVHLVLPKAALFKDQEESAKASVVVKLKSGKGLSSDSIFGITYLVASAVPGLRPEHITILDVQGNLLSLPARASLTPGLPQAEMDAQIGMGKELDAKVLSILEPVVGRGKVTARSTVELNLDRVEETSETFDPEKAAVARRQVTRESAGLGTAQGGVGGVVGVQGNQAGGPPATTAPSAANSRDKQDEQTQFELSKTVRHTVQALGRIKRLSVAVIVDDKLVYKEEAKGRRVPTYVSRTPEELRKIRDLVIAAVGFEEQRGDQITVENLPFQILDVPTPEPTGTDWTQYWNMVRPLGRYLGVGAVVLFGYLMVLRPFKRKILEGIQMVAVTGGAPTRHLSAGMPQGGALPPSLPPGTATPGATGEYPRRLADVERELEERIESELASSSVNAEARRAAVIKKRIAAMAKDNPQDTAQLIRTWVGNRHD